MTLHILSDLEQGTEEWHSQRRGMVTASVVGSLITARAMTAIEYGCPDCGAEALNPCLSKRSGSGGAAGAVTIKTTHSDRVALAASKASESALVLETSTGREAQGLTLLLAAERITGHTDPTNVSDDMLRGVEDEPRAVDVYADTYGPVNTVGFMIEDQFGFQIGYSPDGLVGDDGLIEVKSRRQKRQLSTVLDDVAPAEHMAQMQCGLLVSGRAWCDYISYCGGMHLWRKRVLPDPFWFDAIVAAVKQFETTAEDMVRRYRAATEGLPLTERVVEMEMTL